MASEEQKNDESVKGFAGLSSMVSDVDDITTNEETRNSEPPIEAASTGRNRPEPRGTKKTRRFVPPAGRTPQEAQSTSEPESSPEPSQQAQQPPSDSSGIVWLLGICAFIFFVWLVSESGNNSNKPAAPTSYSSSSAIDSSTQSLGRPQQIPTQPSAPIRPSEEKPPVGTGINFGAAQIRYCLAEDIRLEGAKGGMNNYLASDVNRFNAMVTDYNSRCGHFRYRNGALESAKSEVERYREVLEFEGRARFTRTSSIGSQQILAKPTLSIADNMVLDLQKRLNELGYDAGKADGLAGGKTRTAIMAVQRVLGIPINGIASVNLLKRLDSISQKSRLNMCFEVFC